MKPSDTIERRMRGGLAVHPRTPIQLQRGGRAAKIAGSSRSHRVARPRKELDESTFEGKFAARLRTFMAKADIDAHELAKRCDVTRAAVDHWLGGRRTPPVDKLPAIAEALGVSSPRNLLPQ